MPAYAATVNVEALLVEILRTAGVSEAYAERIGKDLPFLLVERAGGESRSSASPGKAQVASVQIDAWATTKAAAHDLYGEASLTLRSAVRDDPSTTHGVLVRAEVPEPNYAPDSDVLVDGRPAPRYFGIARIVVTP